MKWPHAVNMHDIRMALGRFLQHIVGVIQALLNGHWSFSRHMLLCIVSSLFAWIIQEDLRGFLKLLQFDRSIIVFLHSLHLLPRGRLHECSSLLQSFQRVQGIPTGASS